MGIWAYGHMTYGHMTYDTYLVEVVVVVYGGAQRLVVLLCDEDLVEGLVDH
jgi:hypothetical protein